jgi:hypothetical protein
MLGRKWVSIFLTLSVYQVSTAFSQETVLGQPKKMWVFAVGLIEWADEQFTEFPQENRQDVKLVQAFQELGVPRNQIVYLQDEKATTERVEREFKKFLLKPAEDDMLILYYCGHGYNIGDQTQTYLATYDASDEKFGIRIGWFLDTLERLFKGERVLIAADHCCSGGLAESLNVLKPSRLSYAAFCSAHVNSESTDAWTFTEAIIDSLRGEKWIDDNSDGRVTLQEVASNIELDMSFAHNQMSQYVLTGSLKPTDVLAVSEKGSETKLGERLEVLDEGTWYAGYVKAIKEDQLLIHYYGWPKSEEEWVTSERIRPQKKQTHAVGTRLWILSGGIWEKGQVRRVKHGLHLIKFDEWEEAWNEWVPFERTSLSKK